MREYKRPEQFVTHNFVGGVRTNIDEYAIAKNLDITAVNPYHARRIDLDGAGDQPSGDLCRSLKQQKLPRDGDQRADHRLGLADAVPAI